MVKDFVVTGMSCAACSARVEKAVRAVKGVSEVSVNLLTGSMRAEFDEKAASAEQIIAAVTDAGYGASLKGEKKAAKAKDDGAQKQKEEISRMKKRLIWSFVLLIPLMYVSMGSMLGLPIPSFLYGAEHAANFALIQLILCLPVAYINRAYYERGFKALKNRAPSMDTLIALGSAASLVYGVFALFMINHALSAGDMEIAMQYHHDLYFESSVMILALINLGKYMEARSKGRTGDALRGLIAMKPTSALLEREGIVTEVEADTLTPGDIVQVKPGARIPADGVILEGGASIDESAITGESMPAEKEPGDRVTAATVNLNRFFRMRVTQAGEDTAFAQIIRMVEDAGAGKAPIARLADRISGIFVPVVMAIALVTAIIWLASGAAFTFALSRAISVLVISCPCALGLATPVAIMVGTGRGADGGVLIRSGEALERAHDINCAVMDKTGTLTRGQPAVTRVISLGRDENALLRLAAALEAGSEHPLSRAVTRAAAQKGLSLPAARNFESVPGRGVKAEVEGRALTGGSVRWMEELGVDFSPFRAQLDQISGEGATPLLFAEGKTPLGIIAAADEVKPTAQAAVKALTELGVEVVMLTGDNERTARAIAGQLGIARVVSGVLPADKAGEVERLRGEGRVVAMVGDGINDAPALKTADVGIAIGAGADIAIESADIILMHSDPMDVAAAIRLSRQTIKNIKENLFWAFFYNALGIPLAAGALYPAFGLTLNPMIAAAAMSVSSVFVVTNALRLRRVKLKDETIPTADAPAPAPVIKKEVIPMITLKIEGMMCMHCQARVKKALEAVPGVTAEVDLENKEARVTGSADKDALVKAVTDAGYEVISAE